MYDKRIVLIPAYEPDASLLTIAEELKQQGLEIVIVNDGSSEDVSDIFAEAEKTAAILNHEKNCGKGAAIKTGLEYINEHFKPPYTVVTVDADGQHRVNDAINVLQTAGENRDSLVLGSRRFSGKVPIKSRLGNTITRLVYRVVSGVNVYDTQTGLRAFSDILVPCLLEVEGDRYEYEMNVLMKMAREKRQIREVWIETVYLNDNASSHFHAVKDSFRIYKEILKFSASSLAAFFTDYVLYCLLIAVTGNLVLSNVSARIVSASVNYTMNRKIVFRSNVPVAKSVAQYAALALVILTGNTIVLKGLTSMGGNLYFSKIVTELLFFLFSWIIQRSVVFRGKEVRYEKI